MQYAKWTKMNNEIVEMDIHRTYRWQREKVERCFWYDSSTSFSLDDTKLNKTRKSVYELLEMKKLETWRIFFTKSPKLAIICIIRRKGCAYLI